MRNLYSLTKGQAAIIALVRVMRDRAGNLPSMPGIFPDYLAPIARTGADGVRELAMARWGTPGRPAFGGAPITNIRNAKSPHWRAWLKPENRCVAPFTSFREYADTKPRKTPTWFALSEDRPLAVFAGIWTVWHGKRGTKTNPVEGQHELFGFLTTETDAEIGAIHPKAMPVILAAEAEIERSMSALRVDDEPFPTRNTRAEFDTMSGLQSDMRKMWQNRAIDPRKTFRFGKVDLVSRTD
jgi:putative SOS response-associated peptidase YedK